MAEEGGSCEATSRSSFEYAAFLSYSTIPDYQLVRRTEAFLERFHKDLPSDVASTFRPLKICADGSDFAKAKSANRESDGQTSAISGLIQNHLRKSEHLVVFCNEFSARSPWVDEEVDWFLRTRGPDEILLVVSGGTDKAIQSGQVFPPAVLSAALQTKPWYDFRQAKHRWWRDREPQKVRDYEDARVQLACHLNGASAGNILPAWRREQARRQRNSRRRWIAVAATIVVLLAAVAIALPEARILNAVNRLEHRSIAVADVGGFMNHVFDVDYIGSQQLDLRPAVADLRTLFKLGRIRALDLSFSGLASLEGLETIYAVETLKLEANQLRSLTPLRNLRSVRVLGLANNSNLTDDSLQVLSHVGGVEELDLSDCPLITDEGLAWIAQTGCTNLKLNRCPLITRRSVPLLAHMGLRNLEVFRTGIEVDLDVARKILESRTLERLVVGPNVGAQERVLLESRLKLPVTKQNGLR